MKKFFFIAFSLIIFIGCGQQKRKADEIKIGVILPLTGDAASYGVKLKNGIELAHNQNKSKDRISLIFEDSKMETRHAVSSYNKLKQVGCRIIIGPFSSSEVFAVGPLAVNDKVILLAPTASAPGIPQIGNYVFRLTPSDQYDGKVIATFIHDNLEINSAAVLYINNDYGIGSANAFIDSFERMGGKVTKKESYNDSQTDFRTILQRIKNSDANALVILGFREMGFIIRQSKEIGMETQIVSSGLIENTEIIKIAGSAANGIFYSFPEFNLEAEKEGVINFVNAYKQLHGVGPDIFSAFGYDSYNILAFAIQNADFIQDQVIDFLSEVRDYNGITGTMTFDNDGDVIKTFGIKVIDNKEFKWYIKSIKINK